MARARMHFLDGTETSRIHAIALRLLDEVGVRVHSVTVGEMLEEYGAMRSKNGERMLIPENVVKEALSTAPKSILLAARDESKDMRIPAVDGRMYVANGGEGVYMVNLLTGESRATTSADLRNFAILVEAMPQIDFFWPMVGALEQPARIKEVYELKTTLEWTTKHVQLGAITAEQAKMMVRMASILTDGEDNLAKRPIISSVQCPISPLAFEKGLVEAQVEFARAGIPVVAMAASVAGLTSPVTISGTVAQTTAENLASLVISQAASKGSPFVFSSDSSPGDLKTGSIDYGALETPLFRAAAGQMAEHYGLPKMVAGLGLENLSTTMGNIWEGVHYMTSYAIVQSDLASGFGGLDQAAGASYEQLVLDAWVWEAAREFTREFDFGEDAISFDTIRAAGLDGNFLAKRHTSLMFRKEATATRIPSCTIAERLKVAERNDAIVKAHEEASRILDGPKNPKLDADQAAAIDKILKEW
ncbi:MAG: trimethylamine methyltransferase family protein [Thermoplasmata archaeon]|nr:trimethylamine methyltransferase family protein [Thermoplasmata archaeon]